MNFQIVCDFDYCDSLQVDTDDDKSVSIGAHGYDHHVGVELVTREKVEQLRDALTEWLDRP